MRVAGRLWRAFDALEAAEREHVRSEFVGVAYGAPLAAAGLAWLALATDPAVIAAKWPELLLTLALALALNQLDFFWVIERPGGSYERWSAPLGGLVTISAALLFGPTAIWIGVAVALVAAWRDWRGAPVPERRWGAARSLALGLSCSSIGGLLGLTLYERLGGAFPLPGFTLPDAPLAVLAVLTLLGFDWLCWSCYLLLVRWTQVSRVGALELGIFALFEIVSFLPELFGILAAAVYTQSGVAAYLALIAGALLVSLLAQRLSRAVEQSGQRSRELSQLEQLGRAIIAAPPDGSTLPDVLAAFVPPMFRADQVEIRLRAGPALLHAPAHAPPAPAPVWEWLHESARPHAVAVGEVAPWEGLPAARPLAAAPIVSLDGGVIGGVVVRFSPAVEDPAAALPALQSLAAQIASALYRAEEYGRTLAHQRVVQELTVAAEIQASFLPAALPAVEGWQLAATLRPARQTSGDFYDVLELPGGRLGLVIADVTDKGTGAALFMALSRTLIRTFAFEYPDQPAKALHAANKRILTDSRSSMFVTVFYGVLDPARGTLTYCNAGHNPPYLLGAGGARPLAGTGIPLGIAYDAAWRAETAAIEPGDLVVLYTDGVTEAHNAADELFETERLLGALGGCHGCGAQEAQAALLAAVERFVDGAPQHDDLTVLVVSRTR